MALSDLILFPIYVFFFYLIFSARRKKITDPILKKYHRQGFWIKVIGTIAFTFFHLFITRGDTTALYYTEGINISKLILKDISNVKWIFSAGADFDQNLLADSFNRGYFNNESNYFITKLVTIFSFFSFGSYSVINLFFSMISFAGVWRLYIFFYEQYPHLHKQFALAIIYLPTFVFWSSGILKDPLCTGMLGWFTFSFYQVFIKKKSIVKNLFIVFISAYILLLVKAYILFAYLPFFSLYIVLIKLRTIKKVLFKIILLFSLFIISLGVIFILAGKIQEMLGDLALDKLSDSVKTTQNNFKGIADLAESSFSLGVEFDGTTGSLIRIAPAAIVATLYRPFVWESKKISTLLSSLESMVFMLFTLYVLFKAGIVNFVKYILSEPVVIYCFWYSIVFAVFVGATTLNFGTLVRYKIPCIPFYLIALICILDKSKQKKSALVMAKADDLL